MKGRIVFGIGMAVLAALLVIGCATGGKGPSDEEQVQGLLSSWKSALLEKNTDRILATYADSFAHAGFDYQGADKKALRKFVEDCKQAGYYDGLELSWDKGATKIQGDTAIVSGIKATNYQGTVTIGLTAKKGKTGWLIADMSIEGL